MTETTEPTIGEQYVKAMNLSATPVTIVTSEGRGGRVGQTVSAMTTVSTEPPQLLVCISNRSPASSAVAANGHFRVNILGLQHDHVSDTFAGRPWDGKGPWDFTCGDWELSESADPRLVDAVASFECRLVQVIPAGTHNIFIGEVAEVHTHHDVQPLVYLKRIYRQLLELPPSRFDDYPDAQPPYESRRTRA